MGQLYQVDDLDKAMSLARWVVDSGYYKQFRKAEEAFVVILQGAELGMSAMQSLNSIQIVQGKPTMSAQGMLALVKSSGKAQYIRCVESTDKSCTWETKRQGDPEPSCSTFTVEDAKNMGLAGKDNYKKQLGVMLKWRAAAAICREVYPDVVLGVYSTDEIPKPENRVYNLGLTGAVKMQLPEGRKALPVPKRDDENEFAKKDLMRNIFNLIGDKDQCRAACFDNGEMESLENLKTRFRQAELWTMVRNRWSDSDERMWWEIEPEELEAALNAPSPEAA